MAVALRSSADLLYVPDHGFVGENGALRILMQITRPIHRLDVSQNLLGNEGVSLLVTGIATTRHRLSTPERMWAMREMNLGSNGIGDEALEKVLTYAKRDWGLRKVWVGGNDIELRDHLEQIINSLNASHLQTLSLTNNPTLQMTSLERLLRSLDSAHLVELHLSTCNIGPELGRPIASYIRSARSRRLEMLELNGNKLGLEAIRETINAIEQYNFTIKHVGLLANDLITQQAEGSLEQRHADERALSYQVHERLPPLLERNRQLNKRVRKAVIRAIAPSRILLNARSPHDGETAKQVIETVGSRSSHRPFPLLDFPPEVIQHVVRHTTGDPTALSNAQYSRLRAEAEDTASMSRMRRSIEERIKAADWGQDQQAIQEVREDWLRNGRWDRWELDYPPEEEGEDEQGLHDELGGKSEANGDGRPLETS